MEEKRPTLLVCENLMKIIDNQLLEMAKYKDATLPNFLYNYTLFEGLITQLNFKIYYAFPIGLVGEDPAKESFTIPKDEFLKTNDYYYLLNYVIYNKLKSAQKDGIYQLLEKFTKNSGIKFKYNQSLLKEMSIARNYVAHNNCYDITDWSITSFLNLEVCRENKLKSYIDYIEEMTLNIKNLIFEKYKDYTYEKLLLSAWKYTTPRQFSIYDIFSFEKGYAEINIDNAKKYIKKASSGERYLLSIWLENYDPIIMYKIMTEVGVVCNMTHNTCSDKIRFLQELFIEAPYLVNGQNFKIKDGKIDG